MKRFDYQREADELNQLGLALDLTFLDPHYRPRRLPQSELERFFAEAFLISFDKNTPLVKIISQTCEAKADPRKKLSDNMKLDICYSLKKYRTLNGDKDPYLFLIFEILDDPKLLPEVLEFNRLFLDFFNTIQELDHRQLKRYTDIVLGSASGVKMKKQVMSLSPSFRFKIPKPFILLSAAKNSERKTPDFEKTNDFEHIQKINEADNSSQKFEDESPMKYLKTFCYYKFKMTNFEDNDFFKAITFHFDIILKIIENRNFEFWKVLTNLSDPSQFNLFCETFSESPSAVAPAIISAKFFHDILHNLTKVFL